MWSKRSFFLKIVLPWILGGIIGFADDQYYENDDNISLIDYDEEYKDDAGGGKYYDNLEGGGRSSFHQLENQQDDICKEMKAKVRQLLNTRNRKRRRKSGGRGHEGRRGRVKRHRGRYTRGGSRPRQGRRNNFYDNYGDIDYDNYGGIGGRAPNVGQQGVNKTASQKDTKSTAKEDAQLTQLTILNRLVREQQKATDCYVSFFQQRLVDLKRRVDKLGKKPKKSKKRKYSIEDYVEFNPSISEKEEDGGGSDLNPVPRLKRTKHKRNRKY